MKIWKNRLSTANQSAKTSPNLNFCSMKLLTAWLVYNDFEYFKVRSSNTSCLKAHAGFFRLLMKGIFDAYVL